MEDDGSDYWFFYEDLHPQVFGGLTPSAHSPSSPLFGDETPLLDHESSSHLVGVQEVEVEVEVASDFELDDPMPGRCES